MVVEGLQKLLCRWWAACGHVEPPSHCAATGELGRLLQGHGGRRQPVMVTSPCLGIPILMQPISSVKYRLKAALCRKAYCWSSHVQMRSTNSTKHGATQAGEKHKEVPTAEHEGDQGPCQGWLGAQKQL